MAKVEFAGDPFLALTGPVHQPDEQIIVGEFHKRLFVPREEGFRWEVAVGIKHVLTPFVYDWAIHYGKVPNMSTSLLASIPLMATNFSRLFPIRQLIPYYLGLFEGVRI